MEVVHSSLLIPLYQEMNLILKAGSRILVLLNRKSCHVLHLWIQAQASCHSNSGGSFSDCLDELM